jgi:hypothetical protein
MRVPTPVNHPEARAVTDGDIILATVNVATAPERVFRAFFCALPRMAGRLSEGGELTVATVGGLSAEDRASPCCV